ncbi:MAG: deoxycytidylate deaminase [Deltaproteobacteria bacterium HGW-Deltaproteobacteria-4]|nr:MAG: deoxycytidylate deaminase [Deltaproteobacteria bacterium HGW-Deltaproteobacteria-4]
MNGVVEKVYQHRNDFIIIGLTGKIASGCTTAADFLTKKVDEIVLPEINIGEESNDNQRKKYIISRYYKSNWSQFIKICVRDVITTFVLDNGFDKLVAYVNSAVSDELQIDFLKSEYEQKIKQNKHFMTILTKRSEKKEIVKEDAEYVYDYLINKLPSFTTAIKKGLSAESYREFSKAFQLFGDNIRKSGCAITETFDSKNIYCLAERINLIIKILKIYNNENTNRHYFVIDAFRNPFESMFFKERYSAFYLMAIKSPEDDRHDRLFKELNLNKTQIEEQDKKENPDGSPLESRDIFVSQNISACIEKADIHINNIGKHGSDSFNELKGRLVTYVSLIQHPGLITPERDEKLMQIAYTAKLNSGCISRQVGAVVTNKHGAIVSIGWNDVPEGQTQCLLRNLDHLQSGTDPNSYSDYEKMDSQFKDKVRIKISLIGGREKLKGRGLAFCFKGFHNEIKKDKNQVHTRALHAEENAFLQIVRACKGFCVNGFVG